ncbi:MAG: D-aminoacyl-tRNA deacylase [Pirellula sp.]|jgi:D-tyrosyl-tRNA(Tyr) deacylase|nr:D-aminoacyl-tRNA deacylase [Pirellula sp.]
MRAVLQRVAQASVTVDGECVGKIGTGWLVLLGIAKGDSPDTVQWMVEKCLGLRAFEDANGKMNLSVQDVQGEILVVSQFTLYGDCNKGRRPSFDAAAPPELAEPLYIAFCESLAKGGVTVARGRFRADMKVQLLNEGPVTLILER